MKAKYAKHIRFPGWLFLIGMSLFLETLLHVWTADTFVLSRFATVLVFALAFGCALGLITTFLPAKAEKWVTVVIAFLMTVLSMVEFFLHDAFQYFMPLISIFDTAGDVAAGYTSTIISLIVRNLWRIGLVLLPIVLFAAKSIGTRRNWQRSLALTLAAALFYGGGIGMVRWIGLDTAQLSAAANFDGTVSAFGLSMGVVMDLSGGAVVGEGDAEFVIPEQTEPPVVTTEDPQETQEPAQTTAPAETTIPTEPPVVYGPHVFDLDFAALAQSAKNKSVASIHQYVASLEPAMENEYTGLFEGKNLILITAEAFSHKVIDPELTPTLYRMANEGIKFTDYYHPVWGCGTTGGEFANVLGLVPVHGTAVMKEVLQQDMFLTMGKQLQKLGYSSAAYHNNDRTFYDRHMTHTSLGYDKFIASGNGLEKVLTGSGWPKSDLEMFDATIPEFLDQQPFSLYYMTVSGHSSYSSQNMIAKKNYDVVKDLACSEPVKYYLAANLELEYAMASLIRQLEDAGIADDTVIVISTDHYPYGLDNSNTWGNGKSYLAELYDVAEQTEVTRDQNALIIWSGCLEDMDIVVEEPVFALDILPTLSNLFGLEYDSRLFIGRDVLSDAQPLVFWPFSQSWKTEKGLYNASKGKFTPVEGAEIPEGYVKEISAMVKNKIIFSKSVQNLDYFDVILELLAAQEAETTPTT